jgi:predicted HicB family RNase H-like nuclease
MSRPKRQCSKCTEPHHARGLCTKHYHEGRQYREPALVFRADPEMYAEVVKRAKLERVSLSELVRTYVEWGLEVK